MDDKKPARLYPQSFAFQNVVGANVDHTQVAVLMQTDDALENGPSSM